MSAAWIAAMPEEKTRADSLSRRFGNGTQRCEETLPVGVLSDPSVVAAYCAIHSTDETGRLGKLIKQFDHRDLVR